MVINKLTFELTEQETKDAQEFMREHRKVCAVDGETNGRFYFKFVPNGIGHSVEVGCNYCGDCFKDITDVSNW